MPRFRKRPVVIEATRVQKKTRIWTREGHVNAYPGDWLIIGVEGEMYPCSNSIFEKTHKPVGDGIQTPLDYALRLLLLELFSYDEEHELYQPRFSEEGLIYEKMEEIICGIEEYLAES